MEINQIDGAVRIELTRSWAVGYRFAFSIERSLLLANRGYLEYVSRCECWGLALELGASRGHGVSVNVRYYLLGLGDDVRRGRRADTTRQSSLDAFGGV